MVKALIVEPTVKLVARTVVEYGLHDGEGIYPGNERLARQTGYDVETVRRAMKVLRSLDMALRVDTSRWNGRFRTADEYVLQIPDGWRKLPIYGPNFTRFHCQHCGKAYNPQAGTGVNEDETVGWYLYKMVFCPAPGTPKRRKDGTRPPTPPSCRELWELSRKELGQPGWGALPNAEAWEMFRKARSDDWPR